MRLKATSIVESITAMIIILLSFGVGMMIYMNVLRSEKLVGKAKASIVLNEALRITKEKRTFKNDKKVIDNLKVIKSVSTYDDLPDTYTVKLEAFDAEGELTLAIKEIVFDQR